MSKILLMGWNKNLLIHNEKQKDYKSDQMGMLCRHERKMKNIGYLSMKCMLFHRKKATLEGMAINFDCQEQ